MWRFLSGVDKPEPKSKKSEAEKRKYYADYELNKRQRKFNQEWSKGRPWLEDKECGLTCTYCTEFASERSLSFISGCTSYKLDSIVKHERSQQHKMSTARAHAKSKSKSESSAGKIIITLNQHIVHRLTKLFRTSHALVLNNRPFTDYIWMCELDEFKGLELGQTYRNAESCKKFVKSIAEIEFYTVQQEIQKAKFLCVIGDGSTDSSVLEQEMWFCRYCTQGQVFVKFIGVNSPERANADGVVQSLKHCVSDNLKYGWGEFSSKLAALACDGASVMVGARAGVGAKLRAEQPSMITIHCMAHRLELCLKDACKKLKLYEKSISVLSMGIYYFYHNSALNRSMLLRAFDAMKSDDYNSLLLPTRVGGTRWIGHTSRALTNLLTSYKFIVTHLGQLTEPTERVSTDSKAKAVAFLRLFKSKDIICFLHFMLDILCPLKRLSKMLQQRDCSLASQFSEILSTLEVIKKYKTDDGPNLRKVKDIDEFHGTELLLTHKNTTEFAAAKVNLLQRIQEELEKRFAEFTSPSLIQATRIAHLITWPKCWEALKGYGDKDMQTLCDHFQNILANAGVDTTKAEMEWTILKKRIFDEYLHEDRIVPDWAYINGVYSSLGNVLAIIDLILTISPSSAEAERGFSQLKLIKTDIRSRLGENSLNHCLGIKLLSEPIATFDPMPAIEHWNGCGTRARRPMLKEKNRKSAGPVNNYSVAEAPIHVDVENEKENHLENVEGDPIDQPPPETVKSNIINFKGDCESESDYDSDCSIDSDLDEGNVFNRLFELRFP